MPVSVAAMIDRDVHIEIDQERCVGCGLCVAACPSETLVVKDGKAVVAGDRSLSCGHCEAACPVDAIRVAGLDSDTPRFRSFESSDEWIPFGRYDVSGLSSLMRSRRSCRNYNPDPVRLELLEDLINVGICAPSGTNSQKWTFTVLPDRAAVMTAGDLIGDFFRKLNRLARNSLLRKSLKLIGKGTLDRYYRNYYRSVQKAIEQYDRTGRDRLFHGATAAIIVGSRPGASCPAEDALLASQNILLAAHALGLGSCLIGFAVEAMKHDRNIARKLGIPDEENVHAVIALGWPEETYRKVCGRKRPVVRIFSNCPVTIALLAKPQV